MKIRFGYVSISNTIGMTTSSTMTYTNFKKQNYPYNKLYEIINNNLNNLIEILK